jgi:hypothetical protein
MKNMAIAASVGTILLGAYSHVYACNQARSAHATAKASKASKEVIWYAVDSAGTLPKLVIDDKTFVCKTVETATSVCKTVQSVAPIAIEVDVPSEAFHMTRVIHIQGAAVKHANTESTPVDTVKRTVKVAATLGRAFVTTVGAVFGTLIDAAVAATSSLV